MNIDEALPGFIVESTELLRDMESGLLQCTAGAASPETINLIFRCAHTIKGSAGLFGLDPIVKFVHVVETLLDEVRLGRTAMSEELVALLLACKDHIQGLLALVESASPEDAELTARGEVLLSQLHGFGQAAQASGAATGSHENAASAAAGSTSSASESAEPAAGAVAAEGASLPAEWHLSVKFAPGLLTAGMDPLGFIRYLNTFCVFQALTVTESEFPSENDFNPEQCYLGFEIDLVTDADQSRIEGAFEFVREDCVLKVTRAGNSAAAPAGAPAATAAAATTAAATPAGTAQPTKGKSNNAADGGAASRTVRVDAAKLDQLITRIGELIIAAAGVSLQARKTLDSNLSESVSTLATLVEDVRSSALQLRMVKIGGTFDRFKRVVHDVSRELGKDIKLSVRGEDTELDKTVVEQITDPLTHLVRNAIDHGIESGEVRAANGKPAAGTVTLNAYHDSGSIVIEVQDDGGGLKRERILQKAREKGLIDEDRVLTDPEILNLIFEPGFSTAESVTNLSGRGVGMDVVKRNITALRGTVSMTSTEGQGTTVSVRLPLTLAIINGFQVAVGKSNFVLPLEAIDECIEYSANDGHDFTNLRGHVLPFLRLRELMGTNEPPARRPSIVVVRHGSARAGLVVDTLLGEFQTVIKPLGKMIRKVDYVSGSSILGTGEVALILDVPALVQHAVARGRTQMSA